MTKTRFNIAVCGLALTLAAGVAAMTTPQANAAQERGGTEQPGYTVVAGQGAFEVRDYPAIIVAEVTHKGSRRGALNAGFGRLAAYIFGQDRPDGGERIAMTSPVLQDQDAPIAMTSPVLQDTADEGSWRTRFVMPSKFTMETLPTPPDDITLTEIPARRMATVRFAGVPDEEMLGALEMALRGWIEQQEIQPAATAAAEYAFYDSPMVPARYRRNEIMIPVAVTP